jgi:electron transfer flavoprotein beta subunit
VRDRARRPDRRRRRRGHGAHPGRRRGGRAATAGPGGRLHGRHETAGRPHDLVLLGNDAADSGDFQVGIRLAYELGRPVVNGASTVSVEQSDDGAVVVARVQGPVGVETYRVPLPAVVTIREGGVEPGYPSVPGRIKAKKVPVEERPPVAEPTGPDRVRLTLPPPLPSAVQILGEGPAAAPAVVDVLEELGVLSR